MPKKSAPKKSLKKKSAAVQQPVPVIRSPVVVPEKRSRVPKIFRKKSTYVILAIILASVGWYLMTRDHSEADKYEIATVERMDLKRTVEVTGEMKPTTRLDLAFERGGTIRSMPVQVGDVVREGDVLAELEDVDLLYAYRTAQTNLSAAQARLDLELAGEKSQTISIAEANVQQAEASLYKAQTEYDNAKLTVEDDIRSAEIAVQTAENTLENQELQLEQDIDDAYDDLRVSLLTALGPLQTALSDGDRIIGVDDTATNALYEHLLGAWNSSAKEDARTSYLAAKEKKNIAVDTVKALSGSSGNAEIDAAASTLYDALLLTQAFLTDVQAVLSASLTGQYLTATELEAMKTEIDTDRTNVSTQSSSVLTAMQSVKSATLEYIESVQNLEDKLDTAEINLQSARTNASTKVASTLSALKVAEASLASAQADLDLKKSEPRSVDLDPLRASVSEARVKLEQAEADLKKIQILAPIDGTVSELVADIGERVASNGVVLRMIGIEMFDIEALLPEADVALISVGQTSIITLDAYGDDLEFDGKVISVEPDQTIVQDAVYYKSRIGIEAEGREVKPGMTANVTILIAEEPDVLVIPTRSVRTDPDTGSKLVRVIDEDGTIEERTIDLGLRGDEGRIAVTDGLREGESIIVSERTK